MRLGKIQGVRILDEGQFRSIWFYKERIGHISLKEIRRRDFKVSAILAENGYQIDDPEQFDIDLKELLMRVEEKKRLKSYD